MELPKNITQIGETDSHCKIFVEDYVVSYLKQLNQVAQDKEMAVALYGERKEQESVSYIFLYGAAKLDFLQKETRQLSQVQLQEIERFRKIYFEEYTFLGYCVLSGEMIEGFHICENGIIRYVTGYAQFYEKNDSMLAYMLNTRKENIQPEVFDNEKYDVARRREARQEIKEYEPKERGTSVTHRETTGVPNNVFRRYKAVVVAVFALVCVMGYSYLQKNGGVEKLQEVAGNAIAGIMERQLLTDEEHKEDVGNGTIATQDKLTSALEQENQIGGVAAILEPIPQEEGSVVEVLSPQVIASQAPVLNNIEQPTASNHPQPETPEDLEQIALPDTIGTEEPVAQPNTAENTDIPADVETNATPIENKAPVTYIVKQGDTLTGISLKAYGTDKRILEICNLNQILNPDDIKEGQKIFLP